MIMVDLNIVHDILFAAAFIPSTYPELHFSNY